jgi:gas vesicle protein
MASESAGLGLGSLLTTFALGAAVGATIALLTAPGSGAETRERLKRKGLDLGKSLQDLPESMRKAGSRAVQAGQAAFDQSRGEVARATDIS